MAGNDGKQRYDNYGMWALGIVVGLAIGIGMGLAMGNIGAGIALGMGIGVAFGIAFQMFELDTKAEKKPDECE